MCVCLCICEITLLKEWMYNTYWKEERNCSSLSKPEYHEGRIKSTSSLFHIRVVFICITIYQINYVAKLYRSSELSYISNIHRINQTYTILMNFTSIGINLKLRTSKIDLKLKRALSLYFAAVRFYDIIKKL
jgi:hypothetical protein